MKFFQSLSFFHGLFQKYSTILAHEYKITKIIGKDAKNTMKFHKCTNDENQWFFTNGSGAS
jgi:hypothetical protein